MSQQIIHGGCIRRHSFRGLKTTLRLYVSKDIGVTGISPDFRISDNALELLSTAASRARDGPRLFGRIIPEPDAGAAVGNLRSRGSSNPSSRRTDVPDVEQNLYHGLANHDSASPLPILQHPRWSIVRGKRKLATIL